MGTRSLTVIKDKDMEICVIYQQYDGYPSGVGKILKDICKDIKIINGFGGEKMGESANGMSCFAAQMVKARKEKIGNVYIYPTGTRDCGEDYVYTIYPGESNYGNCGPRVWQSLNIKCESGSKVIYDGPAALFDTDEKEEEE